MRNSKCLFLARKRFDWYENAHFSTGSNSFLAKVIIIYVERTNLRQTVRIKTQMAKTAKLKRLVSTYSILLLKIDFEKKTAEVNAR